MIQRLLYLTDLLWVFQSEKLDLSLILESYLPFFRFPFHLFIIFSHLLWHTNIYLDKFKFISHIYCLLFWKMCKGNLFQVLFCFICQLHHCNLAHLLFILTSILSKLSFIICCLCFKFNFPSLIFWRCKYTYNILYFCLIH